VVERSDAYILGRLVERLRLLIAISDEVPIETKLQTQGVLKMFEVEIAGPESGHDRTQIRAQYAMLYGDLSPYADLEALLSAMRTFLPYL
jgi:hypothetical protein